MSAKGLFILDAVLTAVMALMAAVGVALGKVTLDEAVVVFVLGDLAVDTGVLVTLKNS